MSQQDSFGQDPYNQSQPPDPWAAPSPRPWMSRRTVVAVIVGILAVVCLCVSAIVRGILADVSANAASTAVYSIIPTATELMDGPAVRDGGTETQALVTALQNDPRVQSARVLLNDGEGGTWLIMDITSGGSCEGDPDPCAGIANDFGALAFAHYPGIDQLAGMAVVVDGQTTMSAPMELWRQMVPTPQP